jgi:hypothetical protein
MEKIEKYKLLSFITLCKKQRRNSVCLYKNESISKRVKDLGIGYNNFKKYKQICLDNNLLKVTSKGNLVFIKMKDVITFMNDGVVNEKNLTFNRFVLFFNYTDYEKLTFKNIYNQIRKSIILRNYKQQQFNIERTQLLLNCLDHRNTRAIKKVIKLAAKANMTTTEYIKSLSSKNNSIISGKYHVSKLVGMSSSTGQRILKELSKKEIKRTVIKELLSTELNRANYDYYTELYFNEMIIPINNAIYLYRGSSITILP